MLNVPEEVKALFKRDDVYKNFRVHFPNGETADFDNSSIVSESVKFTESLCSQQSFRFGLTEASQISFTAVNIPNIRGVTIECALDIDVSSLGMTWINANLSPDGFDFLSLACYLNESEDGGFYRIPYGRFIVDTCPRNHESMWKREITAYTNRSDTDNVTNNFLEAMMNGIYPQATVYQPYLKPLAYSVIFSGDHTALARNGYTAGEPDSPAPSQPGVSSIPVIRNIIDAKTTDGTAVQLHFTTSATGAGAPVSNDAEGAKTNLYGVTVTPISEDVWMAQSVANLETMGISAELSGYDSLEDIVRAGISGFEGAKSYILHSRWVEISQTVYQWAQAIPIPTESGIIYPYGIVTNPADLITYVSIYIKNGFTIQRGAMPYLTRTATVEFTKYTDNDETETIAEGTITFNSTLSSKMKIEAGGKTLTVASKGFANAFSPGDVAQGYLELRCRFASPARAGGVEITALDNSNPAELLPDNYSDLWYDETIISPIGFVEVKFKDEAGNDQEITVQIGSGSSIYDLRDNEVLANMAFTISKSEAEAGITIQSKLIAFLNSIFTPNIPDLTFVPIELSKKGLPYLEAGDAIEIETEDGQIVPSFILRQTISGIQYLSADVESSNGEAMEMIET